jgi:hypothetical protein
MIIRKSTVKYIVILTGSLEMDLQQQKHRRLFSLTKMENSKALDMKQKKLIHSYLKTAKLMGIAI